MQSSLFVMTANSKRRLNLDKDESPGGEKIPKMSFTCKICPLTLILSSQNEMRCHYIGEHGVFPVDCNVCQTLFVSEIELEAHKKMKHSLICPLCSDHFANAIDIEQHINSVHRVKNKFKCQLCPHLVFDSENHFQMHTREVHERNGNPKDCDSNRKLNLDEDASPVGEKIPEMSFTCKICPLTLVLSSQDELRCHYIEEHGVLAIDCYVCQKLFVTKIELEAHKKAKHSIICPLCSNRFAMVKDLAQHINSVHRAKNKFKCQFCPDLVFHTENHFQMHTREVHERGGNPRHCAHCQYIGSNDEDLAKHSEIHVLQECSVCGKSFVTRKQYYKHRKQTGHDWEKEKRILNLKVAGSVANDSVEIN